HRLIVGVLVGGEVALSVERRELVIAERHVGGDEAARTAPQETGQLRRAQGAGADEAGAIDASLHAGFVLTHRRNGYYTVVAQLDVSRRERRVRARSEEKRRFPVVPARSARHVALGRG